jgi:putative ATP-dependent endonuclease of OLD family
MSPEQVSSTVYALFHRKVASKAIAAQYLVDILEQRYRGIVVPREGMEERLPGYLVEAITYVTSRLAVPHEQHQPSQQQSERHTP